ncbi:hypothetical protein SSPO_097910 [Streptomyces antimycoticus]|uniref:Uncharacterized protein n=1 Tax=Streptomyces antimycoticus TaxID=68175 RepID=A0A499UYB2_9ACTN|nr:hypothetical protein SSPO_097910 [Streptomyces antimycoticus]
MRRDDGGAATHAVQQGRGAQPAQELTGLPGGERGEREGHVAQHLGGDPAEAEHGDRPEQAVSISEVARAALYSP